MAYGHGAKLPVGLLAARGAGRAGADRTNYFRTREVVMGEELTVEILKQLPLATVAIIACIALWRALSKRIEEHINDLRDQNKDVLADLRARIMVVEDNLHIERSERIKYLPTKKMPSQSEMKDLD